MSARAPLTSTVRPPGCNRNSAVKGRIPGAAPARGFSLIEVMITSIIVSVGLLGLAKLQAASLSNTQQSRVRSLVATQTASLAAAMHANTVFWSASTVPAAWTVSGGVVTDASGALSQSGVDCVASACSPAQFAAYDVQRWATQIGTLFPGSTAAVACATTGIAPVSCTLTVEWAEKTVAVNRSTAAAAAANAAVRRQFTLQVQP